MDIKKKNGYIKMIEYFIRSPHNPLRFDTVEMRPNVLIMCKLLFSLLVIHRFYFIISDPYIPFFSFFDELKSDFNIFKIVLLSLFFTSGFFLFFNYKVRLMSVLLGLVIITAILASKPIFANHKFICGCLLLLAGLSNKKDEPWLIYIQLSIVYFGAAINKAFQVDWWNGSFMQNWMANSMENEMYITLASFLPTLLLAKILSFSTILIEFLISILILFRKKHTIIVFIILIFHTSLYTITTLRFGHFYENMLIALLVFLKWPKTNILVYINKNVRFYSVLKFLESMNYFEIVHKSSDSWLQIKYDSKMKQNFTALNDLLLYNPLFYMFLFALDIMVRVMLNGNLMHFVHMTLIWTCILYFLIVSLKNRKSKIYS